MGGLQGILNRWRRHGRQLALGFCALWAVGQVFRDLSVVTQILFYIPSPLVAALAPLGAVDAWRRSWRRVAAILLLTAGLAWAAVLGRENRWTATAGPAASGEVYRFVHWNVFRGFLGWEVPSRRLRSLDADIMVISEPPDALTAERIAADLGTGYRATAIDGYVVGVCRGELRRQEALVEPSIRMLRFECRVRNDAFEIMAIDIVSNPLTARDGPLRQVRGWLARYRPDITAGDFNSPRRSRAISPLPGGFGHCYDLAGSGWSYTWPAVLPLYAIDQCILSAANTPASFDFESSLRSDHRLQRLTFRRSQRSRPAPRPDTSGTTLPPPAERGESMRPGTPAP